MSIVQIPQLPDGSPTVTVLEWRLKEGKPVQTGDIIALVEAESGRVEIESPMEGTLHKILCKKGKTAPVGAPLAVVLLPGEEPGSQVERAQEALAKNLATLADGARKTLGGLFDRGRKAAEQAVHSIEEVAETTRKAVRTAREQATTDDKKAEKKPMTQPSGPVSPILMPQAGNSMEEGTLLSWSVKVGDKVAKGDIIAEIETDKATMEVEAEEEGTVALLLADEGDIIPVKEPIAILAESKEDAKAWLAASKGDSNAGQDAGNAASPAADLPEPSGPVTPILMPQAGNSMEEGTLLSWSAKVGDKISKGDIIAEIETDKATMEVEVEEEGTLALLVAKEGDIIPVKEPIAILAESEADAKAWLARHRAESGGGAKEQQAPAPPKPAAPKPPAPRPTQQHQPRPTTPAPTSGGRVKASPAARKVATVLGVAIDAVGLGSGPQGRILSTDVETAAKTGIGRAPAMGTPMVAPAGPVYIDSSEPVRSPLSKMRRAIGKNLVASKQNVPHFYVKMKFDASPLLAYQKAEKAKYKVSINDVLVLAIGRVLQEFPPFRTRLEGDEQVEVPHSNIGIAVGTDNGLIVPVVMAVEGRSLEDLALETRRIVEAGRSGKVEGQGHGVFTISNLGMFGVPEFSAIINPPESGIMAVGTIVEEVIVKDGAMRPGRTMTLTLSADHRVVDGMVAGQFMARLKEVLENPHALD
ncbi:MAG: 2-oxo acid dehydrogenase subunit E2 [Candidatus Sumerlaeia bacterium]|nr:2-oxo acid dehydrogenase subunit E2 [Candidatus Sumerlaeia bacterium]